MLELTCFRKGKALHEVNKGCCVPHFLLVRFILHPDARIGIKAADLITASVMAAPTSLGMRSQSWPK